MDSRILLVSLVVFTTASAGPINLGQRTCSTRCTGSEKFKYTPGTTYSYEYDGSVTTKINGAMEEGSGLHLTAAADIEVLDKCNLVLKLRNVRLNDLKRTPIAGSTRFGRSLEEKPLHFSFQDGRIEELCTVDEDKWVLNIKRGVLSAFQNSMEDLKTDTVTKEIDVAGECDAEYKLGESAWRSFSIVKSKDLLACTSRQAAKTALQATPYNVESGIQSLPLTKGTHVCQHDIHNNGYLLKSDCQEEHIFRPFSKESNGATTSASHRLEFRGEAAGISSSALRGEYRRTNLLYEHEPEPEKNSRDLTAAMDSLKAICEEMKNDVRPTTPRLFAELVYKLKDMDARSLSKLYRYVNNNGVCRDNHQAAKKFFMDAIPMVGTTASVSLISDLVSQRTIKGSEAEMWLSSLAFIQQPSQQMMVSVKTLMESVTATKTTFLSGSALVNSYCKDKVSCSRDPTIQAIASTLESKLNYNCRLRGDKDRSRIMMTLKALGNMGHAPRATQTITRCMMESTNAVDIRLAAIDALRRQPCDPDRARVLTVFSDANEDSEVRIAAYLASMQCATPEVVDAVTRMLTNEKVNQVGSFVWTHLTNLKETSCPLKQDLRKILENQYLQKEFDLDARKYSRSLEGSFFSEMLNAGANVEGNLVWSQKSFVPRSAMMNLTIDLFGQSVNLLEVGGRVEGVDRLLETFFGPNGYFPESSVGDMLKRSKRSASDDKINRIDHEFNSKRNNDLKGSMYFRVFGHELNYLDFAGMSGKSDFNVLEMLIKLASNHDINFSKSIMFLDTSLTIPTILGMPLKLSINGTATVNMQISGKMDIRQAFTSPRSMDITGSIKPSGAVAISSLMSVDAGVARTGLKMVTTLHSSSEIDGSIKMEDGQVLITKFNMPREKIEILNAENKFYIVHGENEVEQTMPTAKRITKSKCTSSFMTQLLGVELCGEISHPAFEAKDATFAPLMGPSRMTVALSKKDTLTGYEFEARFQNQKARVNGKTTTNHVARLAFNTPGSKIDREMSVDFLMNSGERKLNFNLVSPWTKVSLNGEVINSEESKQANLRLVLNDKDEYAFLSQFSTMSNNGRTSYSPNIEIRMPKRKPITVSGMLDYVKGRKVDVNLVMENLFQTPVTVKGGIEKEVRGSKTRFSTNMDIKSHYLDTKVSGYVDNKPSMYKSRMTIDYRMMNAIRQRLSLNYKIRNVETVSMRKISVDTAVQTTQWPEYNFELSTDVQKTSRHAESSLSVRYGADDTNPKKRLAATAIVNYDINGDKVKADGSAKLNFPAKNIDFNMKVNHNHDPKGIQSKAVIEYQTGKKVNFEMNLRDLSTKLMKMTGDITLELPSRVLGMSHQIEEREPREYHHNMFLQWQRGKQLQATSMYKVVDLTHTITSNIQLPERRPININAYTTLDPKNFAGSVQVDHERKIYGLDLGYTFNQAVEQLLVEGHFDARHPARRVTGSGSIKRAADEYSTKLNVKWDADRDETKAVAVEGAYRLEYVYGGRQHTANFLLSYPGRQSTMSMDVLNANGKYQSSAEVQWETGKKITLATALVRAENAFDASIKFTSPFPYVETIGAGITHRRQHSSISTNAQVTWAADKSMKIETTIRPRSAKNFEATASVATPFAGYRMMTANALYSLDDRSFSATLEGALENRKVGMTMAGSIRNGVNGNMKIEIPMMAHPISAKFSHKSSGGLYDTSAEMTWSLKKISALLKIKPVSWNDMEFTLSVNTPFQKFTTMTVQGIHKFDNEGLSTKVFGQYDSKKIGLEIGGKYTGTYGSKTIEGTIHLNSPFQGYEDMSVNLKHTDDGHRFSSAADATWDDKKIGAALYMTNSIRGWTLATTGRLQVITPFSGYERLFYNWRHNNDYHGITSTHSLTFRGSRYTMSVGGKNQATSSGRNIEGKLNIQTPHEMAKNLNAELIFQMTHSSFKTNVLLGNSETEKIELGVEGSYDSRKNFMGSATVDLSAFVATIPASMKATVKGQMGAMPYTGHAEASWAKEKITVDFGVSPISWKQFEGSMSMTTPFFFAKTVGMKVTSTVTHNELTTILTTLYNGNKAEIYVRGSNKGTSNMINLSGDIKVVNPLISDIAVGMKLMKQSNRIATTISGSYDTYKTLVGLDAEYEMHNGFETKGNAALVLPIFGSVKMGYIWDINTDLKTIFNSKNSFSLNEMTFVANADLAIATTTYGSSSKAHVTIETPLDIARVIKINLDHTKRGNSWTSNLRFSRNRHQTAAFNMEMIMASIYNAEGTGKLTINDMEPISFSVKSDAEKSPYSGNLELSWGRAKKIGVSGTVSTSANAIDTSVTLTTPFEYFKKIAMKVNHKTEGNAVITAATVEYQPGKVIALSTKFDNSEKLAGTIGLTTPIMYLEKLSVSYEHEGSMANFNHHHEIKYQGADTNMAMTNKLNYNGRQDVTGSTHFRSPFWMLQDVKANFVHIEDRAAYTTTAHIELEEGKKIDIKSILEKSDSPKYTLEVTSPYEYLKSMKVNFEHRGQFPYTTTTGSFEMENRFVRASVSGDVKIEGLDSITAKLRLITPIKYYEHMFITLTHGKVRDEWRTSLEGQTDMRKRMKIETTFSTENNVEGSVTFTCPYLGMDKLAVSFEHEGSMTHFTLKPKFEMKWQGEKTEFDGELQVNGINDIKITVNGDTPISGHRTVSVAAQHSTNGPVRTMTATMETPSGKSEFTTTITTDPTYKVEIDIKTPYSFLQSLNLFMEHMGENIDNFHNKIEFSYINVLTRVLLTNDWTVSGLDLIDGKFKLTSPIKHLEVVEAAFTNKRENGKFTTVADIEYAPGRQILLKSALELAKKTLQMTLKTPFQQVEDMALRIQHDGNMKAFTNKVSITLNKEQVINSDIRMDGLSVIRGKTEVLGNVFTIAHRFTSVMIDTRMTLKDFAEFVLSYESAHASYNGQVSLSFQPSATIDTTLLKSVEASFQHSVAHGTETVAHVSYDGYMGQSRADMSMKINGLEMITGNLHIVSPMIDDIEVIVDHQTLREATYRSSINVISGNKKLADLKSTLAISSPFSIDVTIDTPFDFLRTMAVKMSHAGRRTYFTNTANIVFATASDRITMDSNIRVRGLENIEGRMDVKSSLFDDIVVTVNHGTKGQFKTGNIAIELSPTQKIALTSEYKNDDDLSVKATLRTPWEVMKDVAVELDIASDLTNNRMVIRHNKLNEPITLYTEVKTEDTMEGKFVFTSGCPVLKRIEMTGQLTIDGDNYHTEGTMTWMDMVTSFSGDLSVASLNEMSGTVTLKTPFPQFTDILISFEHKGDMSAFTTKAEVDINNNGKIQMTTAWKAGNDMEGTFELQTPYMETIKVGLSHRNPSYRKYESKMDVTYGTKAVSVESLMTIYSLSSFEGSLMVRMPCPKHPYIRTSFSHHGDLRNFRNSIAMETASGAIRASSDFRLDEAITANLKIETPWAPLSKVTVGIRHIGGLSKCQTTLNIGSNYYGDMEMTGQWSLSPMEAAISLTLPSYEKMSTAFKYQKLSDAIEVELEAKYGAKLLNFREKITSISLNDFNTEIAVKTPWKFTDITLKHKHSGDMKKFTTFTTLDTNVYGKIELDTIIATSPIDITMHLRTPWTGIQNVNAKFSHQGNLDAFNTALNVNADGEKIAMISADWTMSPISAKILINTPFHEEVKAMFTHEIRTPVYKTNAELSYGTHASTAESTISIRSPTDVQVEVSATTPFEVVRETRLVYRHSGNREAFTASLSADNNRVPQLNVDAEWNHRTPNMEGKLTIRSIFLENIVAHFKSAEALTSTKINVQWEASVSVGEKVTGISFNGDLYRFAKWEAVTTVRTPIEEYSSMKLIVNHDATDKNRRLRSGVQFECPKTGKLATNVEWNYGDVTTARFVLDTPYFDKVTASAKHDILGTRTYKTELSASYGSLAYDLSSDIKMNNFEDMSISADLKTPIPSYNFEFTHKGNLEQFNCNMMLQSEGGVITHVTTDFALKPFKATVQVATAFEGYRDMLATMTYTRKEATLTLQKDGEQIRAVATQGSGSGEINIQTPFPGFEKMFAKLNVDLMANPFTARASVMYMTGKQIDADIKFQGEGDLILTASVKTPFEGAEMSTLAFTLSGTLKNFNTNAKVTYMRNKVIEGDMQFNMGNRIELTATLKTPFTGAEMSELSFTHDGSLMNFNTNAKVTYMRSQIIEANVQFTMGNKIELLASLKTPFTDAEVSELSFTHEGTFQNFNTNAKLTGMNKIIDGRMHFAMDNRIEFTATLRTPFTGAEMTKVTFTHEGELMNFNTNAKVTYMRDQIIEGNMQFAMGNKIELRATLRTPFTGAEMSELTFNHEGSLQNFNTNAKLTYMTTQVIEGTMRFTKDKKIEMTATVKTPFTGAEMTELAFTHECSPNFDINTNVKLTYMDGQVIEGDMQFSMENKIEFAATLRTPFTGAEMTKVTFTHDGELMNFNTNAKITYMRSQIIEGSMQFTMGDKIDFTANLKTPYSGAENSRLTFSHDGNLNMFTTTAKLHAKNQEFLYTMTFSNADKIELTASLKTPFEIVENLALAFSHEGSLTDFETSVKATYLRDQVIEYKMEMKNGFAATLRTPFTGAEFTELTMSYEGDIWNFDTKAKLTYMRNQVIEYNMNFKSGEQYAFTATLKTPFSGAESSTLTVTHSGTTLSSLRTNAKLNYQRNQVIQAIAHFSMDDNIAVFAQLRTPFAGAETTEFTLTHHNGHSGFRTDAKLDYMPYKRFETSLDYSLSRNDLEITAEMKTPFANARHNVFTLKHNGGLDNFNTNAKLTYSEQEIAAKLNFKNANLRQLEVSAELMTPFKVAEKMSAKYTHNGNASRFECNAIVEYNDMKSMTGNLKFQKTPSIELTVTSSTPLSNYSPVYMKFNHNGVRNQFQQSAVFGIGQRLTWSYKVDFSNEGLSKIALDAEYQVPFIYGTILKWNLKANHNNDGKKIGSNIDVLFNDREYAAAKFVYEGHSLNLKANLDTDVQIAVNHEGDLRRFRTTGTATYRDDKFATEAVFSADDMSGSLSIESPYATLAVTHDGKPFVSSKSEATLNYSGLDYVFETEFNVETMTLLVKMTAPTGSVEINHSGFPMKFTNKMVAVCAATGTYQVETIFELETAKASMKIFTPGMNMETTHNGHASSFVTKVIAVCKKTGRYAAEVNFNKNTMAANLNINTPYGIAVVTHNGRIENFETKSTVNIHSYGSYNAEAKFNLREMDGQAIVATPYGNAKITHNGPITKFTTTVTATILDKDYSLEYKSDMGAPLWMTKINCPFFTYTATWTGPVTNFKYNTLTIYPNGLRTIMETSFTLDKKIAGSFLYRSPVKYLEHLALSFSHHGDARFFETDGSVSWTTTDTITAHVDFRRSRRYMVVNTKFETPYTERFAMNARHQGQLTEFRSSITADYGSKRGQVVAQYNKESATISLMTPFERFESLSASYKMTQNNGYHAEISWAPRRKIMADVLYTLDGTYSAAAATGTLVITTPFALIQSLSIEFENRHSLFTYLKNIMKIELNSETCWDTKAEIRIAADRVNVEAAMTIPHPTTVSVKMFNSEKEKTADVDVNVDGVRVYLNAIHKDESSYYRVKRDSSIKLVVPARTMALTSAYDSSRYQSNHKVEVTLDQERGKKVTYEGTFADRSRSYQKNYEGTVKLTTPLRTLKTTVTHTQSSNNFNTKTVMMWDADRDQQKKMEVDTVYERSGRKHNVAVTLVHPRLNKPISIRGEMTLNKDNFMYAGKTELQYSSDPEDTLTFSGKVNDESYGRRQNYSMSMQVSHPKSLINMDVTSHIGNTDTKMSAGMEMNYLTARRSQENILLRGEIDKLRKSISMKLRTPMKKIAIDGGMKQRRGVLNMHLTNTMDTTPYRHFLEINTKTPSFSLKTTFAPGKMYSLSGTANATTAKIESSRVYGSRITTDGLASVSLNGSKVLYTRLHWTPSLANEIEEYATETFTAAKTTLTKTWEDVVAALTEEWNQHSNLVSNAMPNVAAVASYMSQEADSFKVDGERIKNEWNNMYYRNEFFMRNIDEYMNTVMEYIQEKATLIQFQIRRFSAEWSRYYQAKMAMYGRIWDEKMGKLEETIAAIVLKFRPAWQSYAYAVIRSYQETTQKLRHKFEESLENMEEYKAVVVNYLDDKFDFITYKMEPYFAKFGNVQESLRYYLLSDKQKTYFDIAKERIVSFFQGVREEYTQWKRAATETTERMIVETKAQISHNLDQILGHEYSKMVTDMAQQAVVDMKNAWSEYEIESRLKDLMKGAYYKLDDYARKQVKTLVKNYMRIGDSRFTVFEPDHGRIEAKIFLPLEVKSLDQLPDLKLAEMKQEMEKLYAKYKPSSEFSMWDVYYKYKPTSDVMNWIPPFKAHATLAHGKHFTTFDGHTFEFAGTCSYMLARDFGDANFTVIANYKDGKIESYTIHSNGKKIEIFQDFKVMVNNVRTEMPFEHKNTTISRDETSIKVINAKGFVFTFDTAKDIVTLDISGWYFGKTAGLFGIYDNEPSNDFMMPSYEIADDVQSFTNAWEVAPYCRGSRNLARTAETQPGSEVETVCKKYFESGKSIFRPCFSVVPVANYYGRCVSDLEQDHSSQPTELKACKVMQTYIAECKKAEVGLKAPQLCATCQSPRGEVMYPTENVTFTTEQVPTTNSADVVFVVEEKECNRDVATKLSALASKIEKSLKLKGLRNNRFAVVAFGGHGVHNAPHAHTMEDQIFNDARKMNLIDLDFHAVGSNTDVLSAVSFATKYNFRAGVSKSIVLIPCSTCEDTKKTTSDQLSALLKEQDIVLHLLKDHDFKLISNSPKSNYIFGIDAISAYTSKDVIEQTLRGDTALLRQVVVPKDICVILATKSQGSFFNAQKLTTGRYSSQKSFLDVAGRRFAIGAAVNPCQDCKCVIGENGTGRTICKSCPTELVKLTPAKQHLLGHMGENPEVGPLATPPTMEFDEAPIGRTQTSVKILGQRRPISYRARQ